MPKMKTHKATAKRFKITGTGKLLRRKQRSTHLRRNKSKRVHRSFDRIIPCPGQTRSGYGACWACGRGSRLRDAHIAEATTSAA